MCITAILGAASSAIGAISSSKAASAQKDAANSQLALDSRIYEETTDRFRPAYESGLNALAAYNYEMGMGGRPTFGGQPVAISEFTESIPNSNPAAPNDDPYYYTGFNEGKYSRGPTTRTGYMVGDQVFFDRAAAEQYAAANPTGGTQYRGYESTPYQNYVLEQGQKGIGNSLAARGMSQSGAAMKAANDYAQTTTGAFYDNYLNRLSGMAASGQNAAGNMANAGANYSAGAGNALAAYGNAGSAGAIGIGNALQGGISNAVGLMNYQSMQPQQPLFTPSQVAQVQRVL